MHVFPASIDWENAQNFAGRVRQSKAIRFSTWVAPGHFNRPTPGAIDCLGFTRRGRCFLVDWDSFSKPLNSEHRRLPLV
jgi:hypothetical protein